MIFLRIGFDFKFSLGSPCLKRHCVKIVQIRSFSGPYSVRLRGNMDQKNSVFEQFSRSENDLKTFKTTWQWIQNQCEIHLVVEYWNGHIALSSEFRKDLHNKTFNILRYSRNQIFTAFGIYFHYGEHHFK